MCAWLLNVRAQVELLEAGYPGGVSAYVANARTLLKSSAAGDNPFDGMKPEVGQLFVVAATTVQHCSCSALHLMCLSLQFWPRADLGMETAVTAAIAACLLSSRTSFLARALHVCD